MGKFVLNLAPTGMIPTKEMTPHVPTCPDEIAAEVLAAADQGVNMVHLHARDPETGKPTYCKHVYAEIVGRIRAVNRDLVIVVSTSGRNFSEFEKRSEVLELNGELKPDFASVTLSSLNFSRQASPNSPEIVQRLARKMLDNGVKPELEVFDLGMVNYAHYLIKKGLIEPPYYFNIILGNVASAQADMMTLALMISKLPSESYWSVGAIGSPQLRMNAMAIVADGGVRVGIEDNIYLDEKRTKLATNRQMVDRIVEFASALGKAPYSQVQVRQLLL